MLRLTLSEHFTDVTELLSRLNGGGVKASVKKKSIVFSRPAVSVPVPPQQAMVKGPVLDGQLDIDKIKDGWQDILAYVKANGTVRIADLLQKSVPKQLRDSVLVLSFPASAVFAKNLCETNGRAEKIQSLLSAAVGEKINVAFEIDDSEQPQEKQQRPPGAKTGKKEMDEAANTPAIKTVLLGLDANIIDVKEVEDS